jgi:hypothetical protein
VRIQLGKSELPETDSGTSVILTRCDRLTYRTVRAQAKRLHTDLGRLFRHQIYAGKVVKINGDAVVPFDPLVTQHISMHLVAMPDGTPMNIDGEGETHWVSASCYDGAMGAAPLRVYWRGEQPMTRRKALPNALSDS